jgi:predicted O-linked N-acetylglucosamine transferase (SPINDLY family)
MTARRGTVPSPARAAACSAHDAGDWQRAVALLQPLARECPDDAQVQYCLGDALYQLDRVREALPPLERAARLADDIAAHHYKLGNVLRDLERLADALACYRRALELQPRHAQALTNAGVTLEALGKPDEALDHYRRAIQSDATLLPAHTNLAVLLQKLDRVAEAAAACQALLQLNPRSSGELCSLGDAFQELGRYDDAVRCYERAIAIDPACIGPGVPELLNNIGAAYKRRGALETAQRYFTRALEAAPSFTQARVNLATTLLALGLHAQAIARYREVLETEPRNPEASRNLLLALLYTRFDANELFEEHRAFARRFGSGTRAVPAWTGDARRGKKLRIGYVSSDLRNHPVGYSLASIIRHHDRGAFEVCLYSSVRKPDAMSQWFREQADVWRSIARHSDEAASGLIRGDQVDILVLLAGRSDDNRPLLALHRPAPIQVSMHDPATSGLQEMDYLIADRGMVPRHAAEKFSERVACLPTFYVHPPLDAARQVSALPAARNGWITFGSFNNAVKINEDVVAVWAQILRRVAAARLVIKYFNVFANPGVRSRYLALFRKHGIPEERLSLSDEPVDDRGDHLARYGQIDIALDPFPYNGTTTTFEALGMGVPVVTLLGECMRARMSAAMLAKIGLPRLIARNEAEYVEIARDLAANRDELVHLRRDLPRRVACSPLCAEQARARQLERLFRRMWAIRVARQSSHADARAPLRWPTAP